MAASHQQLERGEGENLTINFLETESVPTDDIAEYLTGLKPPKDLDVFTILPVGSPAGSSLWMVNSDGRKRFWSRIVFETPMIDLAVIEPPSETGTIVSAPEGGPFEVTELIEFSDNRGLVNWDIHDGFVWDSSWLRTPGLVNVRNGRLSFSAQLEDGRRESGGATLPIGLKYGRVSFRCRVTSKSDAQISVKLWPEDWQSWPDSGNFDLLKSDSGGATTGYLSPDGTRISSTLTTNVLEWRTYCYEWTPLGLIVSVDGKAVAEFESTGLPTANMNVAVQYELFDLPDDKQFSSLPSDLEFDWIRVERYVGEQVKPTIPLVTPPTHSHGGGSVSERIGLTNLNPWGVNDFDTGHNFAPEQVEFSEITVPTGSPDSGDHIHGNFRVFDRVAGVGQFDPTVSPGMRSAHQHIFFGNPIVDSLSTGASLIASGGGTQAGAGNRTSYWMPTLLDASERVVVPDKVLFYYKSKHPTEAEQIPIGLKLIGGNVHAGANNTTTIGGNFDPNYTHQWGFYNNGTLELGWHNGQRTTTRIPTENRNNRKWMMCSVQMPQFIRRDGSHMVLDSPNHLSHAEIRPHGDGTPPDRNLFAEIPQLTALIYWRWPGSTNGFRLSSDSEEFSPGHSLHFNVIFAWVPHIQDVWANRCIANSRNCSLGQTGSSRIFPRITGPNIDIGQQSYEGPPIRI